MAPEQIAERIARIRESFARPNGAGVPAAGAAEGRALAPEDGPGDPSATFDNFSDFSSFESFMNFSDFNQVVA